MRELELDEPFLASVPPKSMVAVPTPAGNEIVDPRDCEEPTRVMTREELDRLLDLDRRPTVRSMQAVYPPSSRPEPVVEVVDLSAEPGRRVQR